MSIMTSSSTQEDEEEEHRRETSSPSFSHRRRWSTPAGGDSLQCFRSLEINSDPECGALDELISSTSDNSYNFYLDGKMSPWGQSGPPLLTAPRSNAPRAHRRGRSVTRKQDLPPFLTTLDCNGRPRFHHRRVRSEGRLEIARVAVDSPEIVSVRGIEGLRIGTVRNSQQHEEEDDDQQQIH